MIQDGYGGLKLYIEWFNFKWPWIP